MPFLKLLFTKRRQNCRNYTLDYQKLLFLLTQLHRDPDNSENVESSFKCCNGLAVDFSSLIFTYNLLYVKNLFLGSLIKK